MVSVPFHLVVLVELVILESLAIAGFFIFRWWRERQDQAVLEALVTATETTALARNHVLKAKLAEVAPSAPELAQQAEDLVQAEILFQKRVIAAFRHERLLSLGHLPLWTEELLVPYQALMGGLQSTLTASVLERQKEIEREIDHLTAELNHSKEELKQTRQEIESLDQELTSTKEELAEKANKVESLEREYVSAFHHGYSQAAPGAAPTTASATEQSVTPTVQTEASTPKAKTDADEGIVIENDGEEDESSDVAGDLTIDEGDDDVPMDEPVAEENDIAAAEAAVPACLDTDNSAEQTQSSEEEPSPELASSEDDMDADLDWGAALAEQAASEATDDNPPVAPESAEEKAVSEVVAENDSEDIDMELDWGAALAEQAASGEANDDLSITPGLAEKKTESELAASDEEDLDLDWGSALAEQAASESAADDEVPVKNAG